jgi:hypothetical protein
VSAAEGKKPIATSREAGVAMLLLPLPQDVTLSERGESPFDDVSPNAPDK